MSENAKWKNYTGHRVLVEPNDRYNQHEPGPRELFVLGASPSGLHVQFKWPDGKKPFWCPEDEYLLIEDLGEIGK